MSRFQLWALNTLVCLSVTIGGAVFAALHIFGRILDRIDRRHEEEVMQRLRRGRRHGR